MRGEKNSESVCDGRSSWRDSHWPWHDGSRVDYIGATCRVGAHVLSFTAPCRSDDVESMVKVRLKSEHLV